MTNNYFVDDNNTFKEIRTGNIMVAKRVGGKGRNPINSFHSCTYNRSITNLHCRGSLIVLKGGYKKEI